MNSAVWARLFDIHHAFDELGVELILVILGLGLAVAPLVILGLDRAGRLSAELKNDLWQRYGSWLVTIPAIAVPILLGAFWAILAVCVLSLLLLSRVCSGDRLFPREADEPAGRAGHLRAHICLSGQLVPSFRGPHSDRHRRDCGGVHVTRSAERLHPARGHGQPQLPAFRNLSGAHLGYLANDESLSILDAALDLQHPDSTTSASRS